MHRGLAVSRTDGRKVQVNSLGGDLALRRRWVVCGDGRSGKSARNRLDCAKLLRRRPRSPKPRPAPGSGRLDGSPRGRGRSCRSRGARCILPQPFLKPPAVSGVGGSSPSSAGRPPPHPPGPHGPRSLRIGDRGTVYCRPVWHARSSWRSARSLWRLRSAWSAKSAQAFAIRRKLSRS